MEASGTVHLITITVDGPAKSSLHGQKPNRGACLFQEEKQKNYRYRAIAPATFATVRALSSFCPDLMACSRGFIALLFDMKKGNAHALSHALSAVLRESTV